VTDVARLGIEIKSDGAIQASSNLDKMTKSGKRAESQTEQLTSATKRQNVASKQTAGGFNVMRGATQQLSYQLQDVAVQAQAGTSAFIILGQQGPQIASIFGPAGAVFGVVIALSAALGGTLFTAMKGVEQATDDLADAADGLIPKYANLSSAARAAARNMAYWKEIELTDANVELEKELTQLANKMRVLDLQKEESTAKWDPLIKRSSKVRASIVANNEAITNLKKAMSEQSDEQVAADKKAEKGSDSRREAFLLAIQAEENYLAAKAKQEAAQEARELVAAERGLELTQRTLMSRSEVIDDYYKDRQEKLVSALEKDLLTKTEYMAMEQALEDRRILAQEANAMRATAGIISMTGAMTSQLGAMFDETSAIGKAFFVVNQAIAAADAIIKGFQTAAAIRLAYAELAAATMNPGLAAAGEAHAAVATAMGFATAGAIAGQTIASFEGGGLTGSGPRVGGLDGKGGRLAVLHPNEKVDDLTQGGGAGSINITIQANDTRGFDDLLRSRRGEIIKIINKAMNNKGREALT
jgi:hypothetical protein